MIIDFSLSPVWKAIGEISGGTVSLDGYWTSAETKDYVDTAVSGIDLSNYYTKSETDSAITAVEDHLFDVEEVTASALTELHNAVLELSGSSVDLSGYYTSGETDAAISAATAGKADAANVSANTDTYLFPTWNEQGVITGAITNAITRQPVKAELGQFNVNGNTIRQLFGEVGGNKNISIYAPTTTGTTGQIAALSNSYTAVWVTPATINGSAITAGGNAYAPTTSGNAGEVLVSLGNGGAPVWSAMTFPTPDVDKAYVDSAITEVQDQIDTMDDVVSAALVNLNTRKVESTSVSTIWKGTQAEYDATTQSGATADPATLYIIVNNS